MILNVDTSVSIYANENVACFTAKRFNTLLTLVYAFNLLQYTSSRSERSTKVSFILL